MARMTLKVAIVREHVPRAECESPVKEAFSMSDKGMAATRTKV